MNSVGRVPIVGFLAVFSWLSWASPVWAQPSGLFSQADSALVLAVPPQAALPDRAVRRSRTAAVDLSKLGSRDISPDRTTTLELNLFEDTSLTAVLDRIDATARGFVWSGRIPAIPMSTVSLSTEDGVMHGIVFTPQSTYVVRFIANGQYAIDEIDPDAFPPEADPLPMDVRSDTALQQDAGELPHGDGASLIDIMVVYTPAARTAAGGTSAINALIANAISVTNTAYANSNIIQRLRLANAAEINYAETGDIGNDLQNVTNGVGAFSGVASMRDTYRADLVTLLTATPGSPFCGVAWLMTSVSAAFQSLGFSVVEQVCAVGNLTFAHELGHNMGLRHDWYIDNGTTPYSYAHGHVNVGTTPSTRWRTIMAYNDKCAAQGVSCTRLTYFSNPNLSYLGAPIGVPAGTSTACSPSNLFNPACDSDERSALDNTGLTVANFRQSVLSVTSLTANVTFPVPIATSVTWTAVVTGGTSPHSFKFWVYDGSAWSVGQDWSSASTWTWTPTSPGTFSFQIWARNAGSSAGYDAWRAAGPVSVMSPSPLAVTALTSNPPGPVWTNTTVTWSAAASGGSAPFSYRFWLFNGASWSIGRDWGSSNTWTWTPTNPGTYTVQVWARNAGSGADYDAWRGSQPIVVNGPPSLSVTNLTATQTFPLPAGTPVNLTAAASGGTGPYAYKFWIYNGTTWAIGRDWGASNAFTWLPSSPGTYSFEVWARNTGSSADYDARGAFGPYVVTAPAPLAATSLIADRLFPVAAGTPVVWTTLARGGTGPYTYKYWVYNGSSWTIARDWNPSSAFTWVASSPGSYQFQVWVRNASSTNLYDAWIGAAPSAIGPSTPLSVSKFSVSTTAAVGVPTLLTAVAEGGLGPYTYKFMVHNGSTWSVGQDWNASSTFSWIPPAIGSYSFQVWVRNVGSATDLDAWRGLGPIAADPNKVQLDVYVTGLALPVGFVQDPTTASLQYVVEQGGTIRVIQNGVLQPTPFLNISSSVSAGGEQGLLGLAFPPNYANSRNFFVYFTNPQGHPVVARFKRSVGNPLVADPVSRFDLRWGGPGGQRFISHPFGNHNGGHLAFGPDGYLYVASGDGGAGNDPQNHGQNPNSLLGKLLRIDVAVSDADQEGYIVPPDNPFVDSSPIAALPEIWAFGVRNPWKFSFDSPALGGTGAMFIGDVGQGAWEEIDYQPPGVGGRNYGWRIREGQHATPGVPVTTPAYVPLVDPIFEYSHAVGYSITGGVVYRGFALQPFYRGRYFYADFVQGKVFSIATAATSDGEVVATTPIEHTAEIGGNSVSGQVSAFGQDAFGEIYVVSYSRGMILRLK
jgi:glucose/arabinose dehydrogenase